MGRGVLFPHLNASVAELDRRPPGPALARSVELYWRVRWHTAEPYETKVLAHPNVHLVFEEPRALVYGVDRGLFVRRLEGRGQVLGVKFRPGGFRPFVDGPVSALADRRIPAAELLGPAVDEVNRAVLGGAGTTEMVRLAEAFLEPLLPEPDPAAEEAAAMVGRITADPGLFRVDQAAEQLHVSVRTLQRLFAEYVGASPKWVLRRARLHEAATRADEGARIDWRALAGDLGYYDQAHLTRDFTAAVGVSPARYARS
ncbi:AraC family transcriptional regulator [Actinomadura sp. NAK00032]|uniref:helix-turn-helix domain-containing protein n=1 Tax=Actinomadura sp. NAK00032 TaxID=2742128 RepID=UPI001590C417|nr:helix-turn-helix domain-containing protein [Actinomadura sp. NAK00032]QKW40634.1 AraC family transcriptional regulator [Actinomadura sp. NAK00032]